MPKLFVHATEGTFDAQARVAVAQALTDLGMECEKLAHTEQVRKGVWVLFSEHRADEVFSGGAVTDGPTVALIVYALVGGLDEPSRTKLVAGATDILTRHAADASGPLPVYVSIQETPEKDWGMYGKQVELAALRGS